MGTQLNFGSLNLHGSGRSKIKQLKAVLSMYDILFVQEHWLFDNRLDVLNVNNDNHLFAFLTLMYHMRYC